MTQDSKFKKEVRSRMRGTGENFTTARRAVLEARGKDRARSIEPHYAFVPPGTIRSVDGTTSEILTVRNGVRGLGFSWGYAGTGSNTAAWTLLLHATGSADQALAIAFSDDHLDWWDEIGDKPFVITVAEVRAWRREAEPDVRARERRPDEEPCVTRFSDMRERIRTYDEAAKAGPRKPWWQHYRDRHGQPSV